MQTLHSRTRHNSGVPKEVKSAKYSDILRALLFLTVAFSSQGGGIASYASETIYDSYMFEVQGDGLFGVSTGKIMHHVAENPGS